MTFTTPNAALGGIPLVLGGNVFGWTAYRAASFRILDAFVDADGSMIDTADVYSVWVPDHIGGESETIIGEWLRSTGKRDKVKIATKVGMLPGEGGKGLSPSRIAAACNASLARLQVEQIDLYYAHQDDDDVPQEEVAAAFDTLVQAGKVAMLGCSNFTPERMQSAIAAGADYRVCQPEYSLAARGHNVARIREARGFWVEYEGALQDMCVAKDIAVLPYFGLAAGFLTGKYRTKDDLGGMRGYRVADYMGDGGLALLGAMDKVVADMGVTHAQVALAWLNAQPGIAAPIASVSKIEQLTDLVAATKLVLDDAHLQLLTHAMDGFS